MADYLDELLSKPAAPKQPGVETPAGGDALDEILNRGNQPGKPAEMRSYEDPRWKNQIRTKLWNTLGINPRDNPRATWLIDKALDIEPITNLQAGLQATREIHPSIEQQQAGAKRTWNLGAIPEALNVPLSIAPGGAKLGPGIKFGAAGWPGPKGNAMRDIARAAQKDMAQTHHLPPGSLINRGYKAVGPEEMEASAQSAIQAGQRRGQDLNLLDVAGGARTRSGPFGGVVPRRNPTETQALARAARNQSPTAWSTLDETTRPRYEAQAQRMIDWFNNMFANPAKGQRALDDLKENAKRGVTATYTKAMDAGKIPIETTGLLQQFNSEEGRGILAAAQKEADFQTKVGAATHSFWMPNPNISKGTLKGLTSKKAQDIYKKLRLPEWGDKSPTMAFWDLVKRIYDQKIEGVGYGTAASRKYEIGRDKLKAHLFSIGDNNAGPWYKEALGKAADRFKVGDAFDAGVEVAKGRMSPEELEDFIGGKRTPSGKKYSKKVPRMNADEMEQLRAGYLYHLMKGIGKIGDTQNLVIRLVRNPNERRIFHIMMGPIAASELEATMATEAVMMASHRAAIGGSQQPAQRSLLTRGPRNWRDAGIHGAIGGAIYMTQDIKNVILAAVAYLGTHARHAYNEMWAEHVARMLVSQDTTIYKKGLKAIVRLPMLESAERYLALRYGAAGVESGIEAAEEPIDLPEDKSTLKKGQSYRNKRGEVLRFNGQGFAP